MKTCFVSYAVFAATVILVSCGAMPQQASAVKNNEPEKLQLKSDYAMVVPGVSVRLSWTTIGVSFCALQVPGRSSQGVPRNSWKYVVVNEPTYFQLSCKSDTSGRYLTSNLFININRAPDEPISPCPAGTVRRPWGGCSAVGGT